MSSDALSETDAAALAGLGRAFIEATLDLLPTPVLLVEPGSAAVTFANRAADELAGGRFPKAAGVELYPDTYFCTDAEGRRVPAEQMPGARVARGERLHAFEMDWHLPHGTRSLLLSGDIVRDAAGEQVGVVVFEDATRLKASERERADSAALLDTLLESAPVGLAFFDRDLRYARVNRELERINGVSAAEHEGRRVGEVLPEMPASVEDGLRHTLESGEPIVDLEVTGRTPALPGVDRRWLCGWYPVRHRDGETIGLGAVVVDVTERSRLLEAERAARLRAERAEQRAAFLARAGEVLASSLHYEETLARVARIAVPDKADWCAVDMLRRDGQLERLAVAHTDPAKERLAAELQSRYPADLDAAAGIGHVVRTGQAELYADIPDELLRTVAQDDEHLRALRELGFASAIVVPLVVRDRPAGALTFILAESGGRYGDDDLELAGEVARRASTAIENARLYRERSHIALTLQRSLLPPSLPAVPGFDVAARYRAAGEGFDVGGDFYDLFETQAGAWAVVIGDVCGKGPEAAALTSLARYTMRAAALIESDPGQVLATTNAAILREPTEGRFMSVAHGCLDVDGDDGTPSLVLATGGHPPALVVRADGSVESVRAQGALLGITDDAAFDTVTVELAVGDAVVLYTDGVLDAGAPARVLDGAELEAAVGGAVGATAAEIADLVERTALSAAQGAPRDDIAVIVLRRT